MVRKIGQLIRRGPSTWLVCIYVGRDSEPGDASSTWSNSFMAGCGPAQATSTASSRSGTSVATSVLADKTVGQYLDHWLNICARPRLRAKVFRDQAGPLARCVRIWVCDRLGSERGDMGSVVVEGRYST
jgi:hypothetical protein